MTESSAEFDAHTVRLLGDAQSLAQHVEQVAADVLMYQGIPRDDRHRLLLLMMARRMNPFFQAVRRLAASGLYDSAAAMLRSLLEQAYVFGAIHRDPAALDLLRKQGDGEMRKALGGLLRLSADFRPPELTDDVLQEAIDQLNEHGGFNAFDWADKSGLSESYLTLYRRLCAHAHGSMLPLADYVHWHDDAESFSLGDSNVRDDIPGYLVAGCSLMLDVSVALAGWSATEAMQADIARVGTALSTLAARTFEHQASSECMVDISN